MKVDVEYNECLLDSLQDELATLEQLDDEQYDERVDELIHAIWDVQRLLDYEY